MKVNVKWGKNAFSDVPLNTEDSPQTFKAHLFELTGVPPERQKLLIKGNVVKDSWENLVITPNCSFLLMGSKEPLPMEPDVKTVFFEDMTESQLAKASNLPPGLQNIGNTCYVNATLQCLRTLPELRSALKTVNGRFSNEIKSKENFVQSLKILYDVMDNCVSALPVAVISSLHGILPHFAETDSSGKWMQQDANEFWVEAVNILNDVLSSQGNKIISQYLSGTFEVEYTCTESNSELPVTNEEKFYQLSCFITPETKNIQSGLHSTLTETLTKFSPTLDRDAVYKKVCKIQRLPAYLTVQLVRFYYKEKENISAKVLRDVKFPFRFDTYNLCTPALQKKLDFMRNNIMKMENGELHDEIKESQYFSFADDIGSNNSGLYELTGVLTHQGRSSSSGHYVAWVKHRGVWVKCDDADVSIVSEESILNLSGGGDWHSAYILLYGPRRLKSNETDMSSK